MSSQYLSDYQSPLIIDVGTDTVKFAQSIDPHSISNQIMESAKKYSKNGEKFEFPLNPNTIFELDIFIDTFPTILATSSLKDLKNFGNTYYMNKYFENDKLSDPDERKVKNSKLILRKINTEFKYSKKPLMISP